MLSYASVQKTVFNVQVLAEDILACIEWDVPKGIDKIPIAFVISLFLLFGSFLKITLN